VSHLILDYLQSLTPKYALNTKKILKDVGHPVSMFIILKLIILNCELSKQNWLAHFLCRKTDRN